MYTPTYLLVNEDNLEAKNAAFFPLNLNGPNPQVTIQVVPTQGTGSASYTIYQTAFQCTGPLSGQPYQFDIYNLAKYWVVLGNAGSVTTQLINLTTAVAGLWVISDITGDATVEISFLQKGLL